MKIIGINGVYSSVEKDIVPINSYRISYANMIARQSCYGDFIAMHLPLVMDNIDHYVDLCSGLILTGGDGDIDPNFWLCSDYDFSDYTTEHVDRTGRIDFDLLLAKAFINSGKPVLAICLGMQIINVVCGGSLISLDNCQDSNVAASHARSRTVLDGLELRHDVSILKNTRLGSIFNRSESLVCSCVSGKELLNGSFVSGSVYDCTVNSAHSCAIGEIGEGLTISSWSLDGLIEAVEGVNDRNFLLGLQWHPELMLDNRFANEIFRSFCESL